jgi:hypothetical protein
VQQTGAARLRGKVRIHKRIEEVFGWMKKVGGLRETRHRGTDRVGWMLRSSRPLQPSAPAQATG